MQFDTLRLRLIKIAARVVELKTQLKIHQPSSAPDQAIFALREGSTSAAAQDQPPGYWRGVAAIDEITRCARRSVLT
jgi:hypothetical protein